MLLNKGLIYYVVPILLGVASGASNIDMLHQLAHAISDIFIRMFNFLSLPLIALSLIVTIAAYPADDKIKNLSAKILQYTFGTTLIAAIIACLLYIVIQPKILLLDLGVKSQQLEQQIDFRTYLVSLIPANILAPFLEHKVITILLIAIAIGFAARNIRNESNRQAIIRLFQGWYDMFIILSGWVVRILPIALFAFITVSIIEFKKGDDFSGIAGYLSVVVLANLVQAIVILPLWLKWNAISPFAVFKGVLPALSVAFFSKSSSGTLPVTIECVQNKLGVSPRIAQIVLPLCTTINMNGCAAFVFTTVTYVAQTNGMEIDYTTMFSFIIMATIAAIGNAGVPMGCFFMSTSLLVAMGIPPTLLGLILPFYAVIDMVETALNVWSDICVTKVIDNTYSESV